MSLDLASITMLDTRETTYSFLAQAAGLMAELDLGECTSARYFARFLTSATPRHGKFTLDGGCAFHHWISQRRRVTVAPSRLLCRLTLRSPFSMEQFAT